MARGVTPARGIRAALPWVLARLGGILLVLWAVATITFFAFRLIPGDPAEAILGGPGSQASEEALAAARAEYGLDRPVLEQYGSYLARLAVFDLGQSYAFRDDVTEVIGDALGPTLVLTVAALGIAAVLALAVAVASTRGGRIAASVGSLLEIVGAALPHFWLAIVLILVFSTGLGWLPPVSVPGPMGLVLPALTLAIPIAGFVGQVMREALLDALASPFVLAARARGESPAGVFWRHALRHAAIPAIGITGWAFGASVSGAVVVESIFAREGLGRTLLTAVQGRDVPLVGGVVLVVAACYMVVTTATDAADRLVDPRLRDGGGSGRHVRRRPAGAAS